MRFLLFDRVTSLEAGRRIVGRTTFSLADDVLEHHFPREAVVPGVLLVEAMAQLLAWGIAHAHAFRRVAILSLLEGVRLERPRLRPGLVAEVTGEILSTSPEDSLGRAAVTVAGEPIASAERIIYAHFPVEDPEAMRRAFAYLAGDGSPGGRGR